MRSRFDVGRFATQLLDVRRLTLRDVRDYGVTAEELAELKAPFVEWAGALQLRSDPNVLP